MGLGHESVLNRTFHAL